MYIYRELLQKIKTLFLSDSCKGLILTGIVGCGKTTLIEHVLVELSANYEIFSFSGDDAQFRQNVSENSKYILEFVKSKTTKRALVFVDEVQKTEEVFDALKIAFDNGKISFIVSGSNPAYLSTIAKRRLQRRADQIIMLPISLSEIFVYHGYAQSKWVDKFMDIIWKVESLENIKLPTLTVNADMTSRIDEYFIFGGLPLAMMATMDNEKMREIRLTTERGLDLMSIDNDSKVDKIRSELARLHSVEFTYKNILERTRLRRRETINKVIDDLINHGYIVRKKPMLLGTHKESYLTVLSYIDPGIVTYLSPNVAGKEGQKLEGYVHARLAYQIQNSVFKTELGYFKPFVEDTDKHIRFLPGEIDFIIKYGDRLIPIEVKLINTISNINLDNMKSFLKDHKKAPYGIILYGGAPYKNQDERILYWPYWLI